MSDVVTQLRDWLEAERKRISGIVEEQRGHIISEGSFRYGAKLELLGTVLAKLDSFQSDADVSRPPFDIERLPILIPQCVRNRVRFFTFIARENECYAEKLAIIAMPNDDDSCPKVIGHLTVNTIKPPVSDDIIEWIEVTPDDRRKGIGRAMWKLAESILQRKLDHCPVTDDGEKFADALEAESK